MQPQAGGPGQWDVRTLPGSPGAHERSGIVPEITRDGKTKRFYPNRNEEALPAALGAFGQQIKRGVAALKCCEKGNETLNEAD